MVDNNIKVTSICNHYCYKQLNEQILDFLIFILDTTCSSVQTKMGYCINSLSMTKNCKQNYLSFIIIIGIIISIEF